MTGIGKAGNVVKECCWDESEFDLSCSSAMHRGLFAAPPDSQTDTVFSQVVEGRREIDLDCHDIW
jgi:hypothetical protein